MRIAIADDDKEALDYALGVLERAGHTCVGFPRGHAVVSALKKETFGLLLLDWNMPGFSAIDVITWAKQNLKQVPRIIVLTSRDDEKDIVHALDTGADDFISKPGSEEVIRARVAAALRRSQDDQRGSRLEQHSRYSFDRLDQTVGFDDKVVRLTAKEFELALLFFENLQRPLSRGYILEKIWNNAVDLSTRTLDMHVSKMRTKLDLRPENGHRLQTIFGYGYRLDTYANE